MLMRLAAGLLRLKRSAAAATAHGFGIVNSKAGAGQVVAIVDRRTLQIGEALRIDHHLDAVLVQHVIAFLREVEGHPVLHPRAATLLHVNAETLARFPALVDEGL